MDRIYDITKKRLFNDSLRTFITLAIVLLIVIAGMISTYSVLMKSTKKMGVELVKSYVADEERNISKYQTVIRMGLNYIDKLEDENLDFSQAETNLMHFMQSASISLGAPELECFAVYKGRVLSLQKNVDAENYDYQNAKWYREAMETSGGVVFTDSDDENDENGIISICAQADPKNGNAVFINLRKNDFIRVHSDQTMPNLSSYYLFSKNGKLLYRNTPFDKDESALNAFAKLLYEKVSESGSEGAGEDIKDPNGIRRGLYYSEASNGCLCVMTIPHSTLFDGLSHIILMYFIAFLVFFAVICIILLRNRRLGKIVVKTGATIRALCNTYFAIYRINLKNETYDMVKGSDQLRSFIPRSGKYSDMLSAFAQAVDETTGAELSKAFSIEHIKQLVSENVRDFGGDFLREIDGKKVWINIGLILDDSNPNEEAVIAFRQIDNEKQQQLRHTKLLESALAAADESELSQKRFFSKMSHEMRTPLNIILGMNELAMRKDCTPEKRLDYQEKIEYAGSDMLRLINNILEISRIEDGLMPLERKEFNLSEEFGNIVQPFKEKALREEKRFEIQMDIKTNVVFGDTLKLSQILNNIISNALQFTEKGDRIAVSMRQAGADSGNYIFTVEDTGIGIPEDRLSDIFVPYYSETKFRDRSGAGGGLGLAIVKSLVTQKGGTVEINSKVGKGTTVIVTLPFAAAKESDFVTRKTNVADSIKGLNILVVDDNELNCELMVDLLSEHGANAVSALSGKKAISLFEGSEQFFFDAIIMDMQMPEMDGCETTEAIRQIDRDDAKWVLIVALTANYFPEDIIRTAKAGMNAHLTKPVDMEVMQKTLAELISKRSAGNSAEITA